MSAWICVLGICFACDGRPPADLDSWSSVAYVEYDYDAALCQLENGPLIPVRTNARETVAKRPHKRIAHHWGFRAAKREAPTRRYYIRVRVGSALWLIQEIDRDRYLGRW